MTSSLFIGWLRGFLDGIGDKDLTKKQVKRIISEAQSLLDPESETEEPETKKPLSRAQIIAVAKNSGEPRPPDNLGDIPKVERQG